MLPAGRTYGSIWRKAPIRRIPNHPAYWGEPTAYRWQHPAAKVRPPDPGITRKVWHVSERPEDDPARVALPPSACPPLVSRELADRVQARLRENQAENAGRNPDPLATIWRGLAVCGHCGRRMCTGPASNG